METINLKATQAQYDKAVMIYDLHGSSGVIDFAESEGITSNSFCEPCGATTPDCEDDSCLVCGSAKEEIYRYARISLRSIFPLLRNSRYNKHGTN